MTSFCLSPSFLSGADFDGQMNTQLIPATGPLLAQMPTGRDFYTIKPFLPLFLDEGSLDIMRMAPEKEDVLYGAASSDEEPSSSFPPVGAYTSTSRDHSRHGSGTTYC